MKKPFTIGFCVMLGLSLLAGCGGGSAIPSAIVPPPIVSRSPTPTPMPSSASGVTLTFNPTSPQIDTNQFESLTATVSNNTNNKGVNWTVKCPSGVTACGSMAKASSASGAQDTYNAPSSVGPTNQLQVLVTAASVSDLTKSAQVIVVVNSAPKLVNAPPVTGNVGSYFSLDAAQYASQYVQGGTPPYTWKFKSGALPSHLTLDAANLTISGIPKAVSASTVVFTATDLGNPPISVNPSVSITINPMLPFTSSLSASGALPGGTVGARYNPVHHWCGWCPGHSFYTYGLNIEGGTGGIQPYVFSWAAATGSHLPPGLALIPQTNGCGCSAEISGTPTTAGTYNFVVTVTDSESPSKQGSANYAIAVTP